MDWLDELLCGLVDLWYWLLGEDTGDQEPRGPP